MFTQWSEVLTHAEADGTALTNSTTATSILPSAAKPTIPPDFFEVGTMLHVIAWGRSSNILVGPGTLTLDIRLGGGVVADGGAVALTAMLNQDVPWRLEWFLTCRAAAEQANLMHQGMLVSDAVSGTTLIPASAPAVGANFDATDSLVLDLFAKFSVANNGNSIKLHQYIVHAYG